MLLFIIIFFSMLIVVGVTMIAGFSVFLKRRNKSLASNEHKQFTQAPPYRSLFEPDAAELRFSEREKAAQIEAEKQAAARQILLEKSSRVEEFQKVWRENSNIKNTAELLLLAAQAESATIFSETSENVIQVWRENRIANLSHADLADLLDSHFRLLPQQERTSGALFWLKREIKNLREKSEEIR